MSSKRMNNKVAIVDSKVCVEVADIFGQHDEEFRKNVQKSFKMDIPHTVSLYFPPAMIKKMQLVKEVADEMHLSKVEFGISLKDSVERPKIEAFDKEGKFIPNTTYQEYGTFDTLDEFRVVYSWFYKTFHAEFHYATGWCEESFKTHRFEL